MQRQAIPYLGANPWFDSEEISEKLKPIYASQFGYIQFIDMAVLSRICEAEDLKAWIPLNTGAFVYADSVIAWIEGHVTEDVSARLADQFVIKSTRTFDQDPRFGLAVMAEVGSRALSPATNDPGTAIEVIGRLTRLMAIWSEGRDDAHLIEVQLRILKSLEALQKLGSPSFQAAAKQQAQIAVERAQVALTAKCDQERLESYLRCAV